MIKCSQFCFNFAFKSNLRRFNKADVDDIHEYLLLKGVEAVAIHGGKGQDERDWGIAEFKSQRKDVLAGAYARPLRSST